MGRSQETVGKKEKEKKKAKNRQDKQERKQERQANNNKGKTLEDMMAYIDENGNISSTPPDPKKKREINVEDIDLGPGKRIDEPIEIQRTGTVTFFNTDKGYGFISDAKSRESIFVHINQVSSPIAEKDKVSFEVEMGPKGLSATKVKKI
jgi:cold shock CspA family protein